MDQPTVNLSIQLSIRDAFSFPFWNLEPATAKEISPQWHAGEEAWKDRCWGRACSEKGCSGGRLSGTSCSCLRLGQTFHFRARLLLLFLLSTNKRPDLTELASSSGTCSAVKFPPFVILSLLSPRASSKNQTTNTDVCSVFRQLTGDQCLTPV